MIDLILFNTHTHTHTKEGRVRQAQLTLAPSLEAARIQKVRMDGGGVHTDGGDRAGKGSIYGRRSGTAQSRANY